MRRKFQYQEEEILFTQNKNIIISGIFSCQTAVQVESCVGFARYLNYVGITQQNYPLFLKLLETNNKWVVDALIAKRDPRLLFSNIQPNQFLIKKAFLILSFWHPKQIYHKVLDALLAVLEYAYYEADDGYKIYRLKINDLNNIGKYLDESRDQDEGNNRLILNVLDKITRLGEYRQNITKSVLAKHAFYIRIAFFDNRKKLLDIIPQVLLVPVKRELYEINPPENYRKYLKQNGA